jgi:hypothetical protein
MKLNASSRLTAKDNLALLDNYNLSLGGNTFVCKSAADAYVKATAFIKKLESNGFVFSKAATIRLDTWVKGSSEVSVGVSKGNLMIDLWT